MFGGRRRSFVDHIKQGGFFFCCFIVKMWARLGPKYGVTKKQKIRGKKIRSDICQIGVQEKKCSMLLRGGRYPANETNGKIFGKIWQRGEGGKGLEDEPKPLVLSQLEIQQNESESCIAVHTNQ